MSDITLREYSDLSFKECVERIEKRLKSKQFKNQAEISDVFFTPGSTEDTIPERPPHVLKPVDLNYLDSQYKIYNFLSKDFKRQDQASIHYFIKNNPGKLGRTHDSLLGDVFTFEIGNTKGRHCVIDFSKDKACQELKENDPDTWNMYFYERSRSSSPDNSNDRGVPRLRLFQDENGKAYSNIKENFAKQGHIPQKVKDIVLPYLEQMPVLTEDSDKAYYDAVATHILKIPGYDPNNSKHEERAMAAGAAMKNFYGNWMTDTVTNGSRHLAEVVSLIVYRGDDHSTVDRYGFVLGDYITVR